MRWCLSTRGVAVHTAQHRICTTPQILWNCLIRTTSVWQFLVSFERHTGSKWMDGKCCFQVHHPTQPAIELNTENTMLKNLNSPKEARGVLLSLLPTSGTLAGIAVGLVGLINTRAGSDASTLADDILMLSALGFLVVCYLIFFAIRKIDSAAAHRIIRVIDVIFLFSLTLIVFSGFIVVYELL